MKTLFALITIFLLSTVIHADIGPSGFSNRKDATGSVTHAEKFYIKVKNNAGAGADLAAGDVVVWDTSQDSGVHVTTSSTAGSFPACIMAESCAQDEMCSCQTYGLASVNFDIGSVAIRATAGLQAFISESNGGKVQAQAVGSYAAGDIPLGVFLDSSTTGGSGGKDPISESLEVFLRLR